MKAEGRWKYSPRKILKRIQVKPPSGLNGDMGTIKLTLECGHESREVKASRVKNHKLWKCEQCGTPTPNLRLDLESGPFRHRQVIDPLDPRLRRRLSPDSLGRLGQSNLTDSEPDELHLQPTEFQR